jgi:hypothetical protein
VECWYGCLTVHVLECMYAECTVNSEPTTSENNKFTRAQVCGRDFYTNQSSVGWGLSNQIKIPKIYGWVGTLCFNFNRRNYLLVYCTRLVLYTNNFYFFQECKKSFSIASMSTSNRSIKIVKYKLFS